MVTLEEEKEYFIFRFSPLDNPPTRDMVYTVYTDKKEIMDKFLDQHSMSDGKELVTVGTYDDEDLDDIQCLKLYKFGSNKYRDKIYEIYTTYNIVELVLRDVTSDLSCACYFNDIICRTDIPLIEYIKGLIDKMRWGCVLNLVGCDEYNDTKYKVTSNPSKWNMRSDRPGEQFVYSDGPDDSKISDALVGVAEDDEIMPITLEKYIESFVALITDEFK